MANTIGTAYVQVEPSFNGVVSKIDKEFGGAGVQSGKSFSSGFASVVGSAAGTVGSAIAGLGKIAMGATAVGAAAVGTLAKSAVSSYASFEQLEGGVSKLYGTAGQSIDEYAKSVGKSVKDVQADYSKLEQAQDIVFKNAQEAYKTAGMSANKYMETATSFSASLINSLGGDSVKAAEMTDVAMRAISDNVNTFGSDMGSVTNAFQGFAKQNYTMLDNLKLGYGGTKEEMARLIKDANEWGKANGKASNLSIDSFADVVTAIEQIQEKQNIAGTTGREAMKTIEGSMVATKAAWSNLVTAIGRGEGIESAFSNLSSVILGENEGKGLLNQILPRVQTVLDGIGSFIEKAVPMIMEKLPPIIQSFLPSLLSTVTKLIQTLIGSLGSILPELISMIQSILPDLINAILTAVPMLTDAAIQLITALIQGVVDNLPLVIDASLQIVQQLAMGLVQNIPVLIAGLIQLITALAAGLGQMMPILIPAIVNGIFVIAQELLNNLPLLMEAVLQIMQGIAEGIIASLPIIIDVLPDLIVQLVMLIIEYGPEFVSAVFDIVGQMVSALISAGATLLSTAAEFFSGLVDNVQTWLSQLPEKMAYFAGQMVGRFITFIAQLPDKLQTIWNNMIQKVKDFGTRFVEFAKSIPAKFEEFFTVTLRQLPAKMVQIGKDIVDGLLNGIKNAWSNLTGAVGNLVNSFLDGVKSQLQIGSPSKVMANEVGKWIPAGIAEGIEDSMDVLDSATDDIKSNIADNMFNDAYSVMTMANANLDLSSAPVNGNTVTVNMNVYGAEGQDVNALAEIIQEKINNTVFRQGAVYA